MREARRFVTALPLALALALLALVPSAAQARGREGMAPQGSRFDRAVLAAGKECEPFDEARVFFELNDTDGDLGIHGLIDGDAWRNLQIVGPDGKQSLTVTAKGSLREHGLTEICFESDEPGFDELSPEEFFERFPEGEWTVEATTVDGECLRSVVTVSHVLPAPPGGITLNGEPAAEDCDAAELPSLSGPVVISWDPVTTSHPDIGASGDVEIAGYQLIVEREEPSLLVFSVDLPADVTSFEIPADFLALGEEFKFEIIARDTSGNQTAVESCFVVE